MRINHNLMAMNTHRQLGMTQNASSKAMEKLSSGLRINRAGDDAAGLAISEKMRGQIRGLNQASRNAQDGISMIQTAEGALNETQAILQRMRELAVQSSNDTNVDIDRESIQDEIDQLKNEIDRIGNTTEFNTKKLLNGDLAGPASGTVGQDTTTGAQVLAKTAASATGGVATLADHTAIDFSTTAKETITVDGHDIEIDWDKHLTSEQQTLLDSDTSGGDANEIADIFETAINSAIDEYNSNNTAGANVAHVDVWDDGTNLNIQSGIKGEESEITFTPGAGTSALDQYLGDGGQSKVTASGDNEINFTGNGEQVLFSIGDVDFESTALATANGANTSADTVAADLQGKMNAAIATYNTNTGLSSGDEGYIEDVVIDAKDGRFVVTSESGPVNFTEKDGNTTLTDLGLNMAQTEASAQGSVNLQIGANKGQTMNFGIKDMRSAALSVNNIDVTTSAGAQSAIDTIQNAIGKVSEQRSALGAVQNRLEHTIKNLDTSSENLQASESRIRDVDMAKEMMEFSKNNILQQAAQSMLAQANQAPQGVLQLLR